MEVVDGGLRQHGVVFQFGLSQHGGVTGDDDQLGLASSQRLDNRLVTKGVLTRLDNQTELGVDVFLSLRLGGLDVSFRCRDDKIQQNRSQTHSRSLAYRACFLGNDTDHLCVYSLRSFTKSLVVKLFNLCEQEGPGCARQDAITSCTITVKVCHVG